MCIRNLQPTTSSHFQRSVAAPSRTDWCQLLPCAGWRWIYTFNWIIQSSFLCFSSLCCFTRRSLLSDFPPLLPLFYLAKKTNKQNEGKKERKKIIIPKTRQRVPIRWISPVESVWFIQLSELVRVSLALFSSLEYFWFVGNQFDFFELLEIPQLDGSWRFNPFVIRWLVIVIEPGISRDIGPISGLTISQPGLFSACPATSQL